MINKFKTIFWKSLGLNSYSLTIKGEEDTIKEKIFNKFITLPMSSPNKVFFAIYRTESFWKISSRSFNSVDCRVYFTVLQISAVLTKFVPAPGSQLFAGHAV